MGLLQKATETFDNMNELVGVYVADREPLAPVGHIVATAGIEITIDNDGRFVHADAVSEKFLIPVSEESSGRTNSPAAHYLCEQLAYVSDRVPEKQKLFILNLKNWIASSNDHPALSCILKYVEGNTIINDLLNSGIISADKVNDSMKTVVRWIVNGIGEESGPVWKNKKLLSGYSEYGIHRKSREKTDLCMISGKNGPEAVQHLKGIVSIAGNAKLISSNDSSNFTYRGRFTDGEQAYSVGYESSQKAHNALKWLCANYGDIIGGRMFLCWNPNGIELPRVTNPYLKTTKKNAEMTDYKADLNKLIMGYASKIPQNGEVIIVSFDAATSGRLAVVYYNELQASDFLERITYWEETCCWYNGYWNEETSKYDGVSISSPSLKTIANYTFGVQRGDEGNSKIETDDKILKQQVQRLVSCRIDKAKFPADIMRALVSKASNLQIYTDSNRNTLLYVACACIRKYLSDNKKEEFLLALETEKKDRSYQYGRLLAVLEKAERDTYDQGEKRETNAIRMQSVFVRRPAYAFKTVLEQLKAAYYPRLSPAGRTFYDKLIGEITEKIAECGADDFNVPLTETYLLGYYLQKNALYTKKENSEVTEND